jgi:integrase/recombinase XerD
MLRLRGVCARRCDAFPHSRERRQNPVNAGALRLISEYIEFAKSHGVVFDLDGPIFRPVVNNSTGTISRPLDPTSVYRNIIIKYARESGVSAEAIGTCVHSMRATGATNALANGADIGEVQEWLGHANVSTTRLYAPL